MTEPGPAAGPGNRPRPRRIGSLGLRTVLALYTVALVLPVMTFTGFLLWRIGTAEQDRLEQQVSSLAETIAGAVDRDVTGLFAALDVLALSPSLRLGDLPAFHAQATEFARRQGITPVLWDVPSRRNLVDPRRPLGASDLPAPSGAPDGGASLITDLRRQNPAAEPMWAIARGIGPRPGGGQELLGLEIGPERLAGLLADLDIPAGITAAVIDRTGTTMARNLRGAESVGRPASPDLRAAATEAAGTWFGTTVDGVPVFGAYHRSRVTGFQAAVGIRQEDLSAPLRRYMALFAALAAGIAAFSTALGLYLARRITRPLHALAARAVGLGSGHAIPTLHSGLREADRVGLELARAATARLEREAALRDANEEIQRFAYIVSHDLRSPLVNIMGFTAELETLRHHTFARLEGLRTATADPGRHAERAEDGRLAADFDEAIGFIKTSIDKMDRLIAAILRLSREGRRDFKPERIDMNGLVAGIVATVAHQVDAAGASVTLTPLPALTSDRLAVEQIFSNLVDNAVKYLRPGVPGLIAVTGRAAADGFVYEVRDNGRGIDGKDRERVFELFRRSGAQDRPGDGIGLAHVKALVRRLGGSIALTSEPGRGSVFAVTLPRRWIAPPKGEAA